MQLWHIAALLIAGIVVGVLFPGRFTGVFPAATLYVFLPALIFEGAWYLDLRVMRRRWTPIALLAFPGVVVTAAVIALAMHYLASFGWGPALLLGAILSATDPVAVVAIFRRLDVPKPLATIVESESLLNDAIAVVLYRAILVAIVASGSASGVARAGEMAVLGVIAGVALGLLFAYAAAFALRERVSATVQSVATFIGAYGVYALCEHFGWSGIFAVLTFGVALRELERSRMSVTSAEGVATFWAWACGIANAVLFFLIGAAIDFTHLARSLPAVIVTIAAVAISRALVAYGLLHFARERLGVVWRTVVRMAGIRGALALALALATPAAVAQRSEIIDATFAVVVLTILLASLTLERRLAKLPLEDEKSA
jgi:monovalent cation:H+ antiporter, CPA1 family